MNCIICKKDKELGIELLGVNLCKTCFEDIANTSIFHKKYDYYKEIIKLILKNYIYEKTILNPIE